MSTWLNGKRVIDAGIIQYNPVDTSGHVEGRTSWNSAEGTLNIETDIDGVVLQAGQEFHRNVKNNSGSGIGDGKVVYKSGGNSRLEIGLAKADSLSTSVVLGVTTAAIANGSEGKITSHGLVRGLNTGGCSAGDTLYLSASTAGAFTNTKPTGTNYVVQIGYCVTVDASDGVIDIDIQQAAAIPGQRVVMAFNMPLRGVTDNTLNMGGEFREVAAAEVGDYATDFAVTNHHIYLYVNTLTGSGDVTITGTSNSESTGVPVVADTETITVDTASAYYQSDKKWIEITNIDIPAGITAINYDIGIVGYVDLGNTDFKVLGYRCEATAQGVDADMSFIIMKVQDDGAKKMSIVLLEDLGVDCGNGGVQWVDNLRTGGDDRSNTPAIARVWVNNTVLCFKMLDFDTYFSSDENHCLCSTNHEGYILRIEGQGGGITNVDFITGFLLLETL